MAKYQKLNEPVFVMNAKEKSSRYGGEIVEVELCGIQSQTIYKTWADPKNNNWREWQHIVAAANTKGIVIDNLKLKDPEKKLVNADSHVRVCWMGKREDLANILEEHWNNQDTFRKLFEV
jgi:hypothetical protein